MNKDFRQVEALAELINEFVSIEKNIAGLPQGYISVKQISGHVYCYRQWREGNKIVSSYVPNPLLNGIKRKIALRKENESMLKVVKKDIKKATNKLLKAELLTQKDVDELIDLARNDGDVSAELEKRVNK